jgi:hypothetical protein
LSPLSSFAAGFSFLAAGGSLSTCTSSVPRSVGVLDSGAGTVVAGVVTAPASGAEDGAGAVVVVPAGALCGGAASCAAADPAKAASAAMAAADPAAPALLDITMPLLYRKEQRCAPISRRTNERDERRDRPRSLRVSRREPS